MRVLVVGSGGREHALGWGLSRSPSVSDLLFVPGNPGMAALGECREVDAEDVEGVAGFAASAKPDLVVVGPEAPLVAGLADVLSGRGIKVFGPGSSWARLEGSKAFAKSLMRKLEIPTADYAEFLDAREAISHVEQLGRPVAIKADGLAAGKGVTVCATTAEAKAAITAAMTERVFGESGAKVIIEERLEGEEISLLAFTDGRTLAPMEPAQDYKRILDGDGGPNTGGVGSFSPVPSATPDVVARVLEVVFDRLLPALRNESDRYVGVVYAGIMLTSDGPKVLEFNCRFGDPETQALIPRLESDLAETMLACADGSLEGTKLRWTDRACVTVVAASSGYPGSYRTGFPIDGIDEAEKLTGIPVFHSGTALDRSGRLITSGGRVLAVTALGDDQRSARDRTYDALAKISFEGMTHRSDIAAPAR